MEVYRGGWEWKVVLEWMAVFSEGPWNMLRMPL